VTHSSSQIQGGTEKGPESACDGPAQQRPLENECYWYKYHLHETLAQYELELQRSGKEFANAISKEARSLGWLRSGDYSFSSVRMQDTVSKSMCYTPVGIPIRGPKTRHSSSSGAVSSSGVHHRRALTARVRRLYFQLIVRQHHEHEHDESQQGAEGEWKMMQAVAAFLSDVPRAFLRKLTNDSRVQKVGIVSAKKLRQKILREIKEEVKKTKKDPMQVLESAIKQAGNSGSMRQYAALSALLTSSSTVGHTLPTAEAMANMKSVIMDMAVEDLEVKDTRDGYRISLKRAVEMEALRLMQTIDTSKKRFRGEVRSVGLEPDGHGWQDHFHIKLTFDARRITKHCAQTEVMIIFLPKGQAGVDRSQNAVHIRTIAVWTGKDSKENVLNNLTELVAEAAELEKNGIAFSRAADSFLKVADSEQYKEWLATRTQMHAILPSPKQSLKEWLKISDVQGEPVPFRQVGFSFWVAADMLAQCSLIGQGCAGNNYCPHCKAHRDDRHLPFELIRVQKPMSFRKLADDYETKVETLWAINTCEDEMTRRRKPWDFTEEGMQACTLQCTDSALARPVAAAEPSPPSRHGKTAPPALPANSDRGQMRPQKGQARKKKPMQAAPAQQSHGASSLVTEFPNSPDVALIKLVNGWKSGHTVSCDCTQCMIPGGTIVRVMIKPGFSRESEYLNKHWSGVYRGRFPFCALHCNMRITEAMFYNICQNALAAGDPAVARLNVAMEEIGLKAKKFQKVRLFNCDNYERLSFLGHEALHLLKKNAEGKRNIHLLLERLWPSGDSSESPEGRSFVDRSIVLWDCWAEVVELMSERDPTKLRESVDSMHGDGFARFSKVCREFCFRYQTMFHKTHCKSFYLHTLLAHAGDFMRELEKHGMCLGMMSNSGAERRHEYGRRAFRRSLCGGCWAKHDSELANKKNMSAYLTLREVLIWQYGSDLLSHEKARRSVSSSEPQADTEPPVSVLVARSQLTKENLAKMQATFNKLLPPLLSAEETEKEENLETPMNDDSAVHPLETERDGWKRLSDDRGLALLVLTPDPDVQSGGENLYVVQDDVGLTNNVAEFMSDISGEGSETYSECCRFDQLPEQTEDEDDYDYDPDGGDEESGEEESGVDSESEGAEDGEAVHHGNGTWSIAVDRPRRIVSQSSGSPCQVADAPASVTSCASEKDLANVGVESSCPAGSLTGGEKAGPPSETAENNRQRSQEKSGNPNKGRKQSEKRSRPLGTLLRKGC
jgi:hypothetical protein